MKTLQEVVASITEHQAEHEVRTLRRVEPGIVVHQGDVYLHVVPLDWPHGKKRGSRQVAVGTTVGSRHVADGDGVEVFDGKRLPPSFKRPTWCTAFLQEQVEEIFLGPVIVAPHGFTLTHPEHAHHQVPACVVQVTYQGDPRTLMRVQD